MAVPVIILLSDYGLADGFVGICHGVIMRSCPAARVIDLSHAIAAHDVRGGALLLMRSLPYLPVGVHVADVGGEPGRSVAIECRDGRRLVGPDNGLLWPALQASGGAAAVVDLVASPLTLTPASPTFSGRDLLAPVAAGLAAGIALADVGVAVAASSLQTLVLPESELDIEGGRLIAHVLSVDRFGNVELDAIADELAALRMRTGDTVTCATGTDVTSTRVHWGRTFADVEVGELVLYEDPQRQLALAVNRASAAARLGLGVDDVVRLGRP